jgi:hypothetical protein
MKMINLFAVAAAAFLVLQAGTGLAENSTGEAMDEVEWLQDIINLNSNAGMVAGHTEFAVMEVRRVHGSSGGATDSEVSRVIDILSSD